MPKIVSISDYLRKVAADIPSGDIKVKFVPLPNEKPPRRQSPVKNKSNRSDYMREYMKDYRENGKDYQKVPDKVKEWRKQKKKEKEAFDEDDVKALFGLGPKYVPQEPERHKCPECGKDTAYYKEVHPDTEMNDNVLVCPCGYSAE